MGRDMTKDASIETLDRKSATSTFLDRKPIWEDELGIIIGIRSASMEPADLKNLYF